MLTRSRKSITTAAESEKGSRNEALASTVVEESTIVEEFTAAVEGPVSLILIPTKYSSNHVKTHKCYIA